MTPNWSGAEGWKSNATIPPNSTVFAISYFGASKIGGAVAATNPTYTAAKIQSKISEYGAEQPNLALM